LNSFELVPEASVVVVDFPAAASKNVSLRAGHQLSIQCDRTGG
jgi:hypothetical protein